MARPWTRAASALSSDSVRPCDDDADVIHMMLTAQKNPLDKKVVEVRDPLIQKELLQLEEQEGAVHFKFGILYAKQGQRSDDEMFSNGLAIRKFVSVSRLMRWTESGSPAFDEFCGLMGERMELLGWEHYRGGLDNKSVD